MIAAFTSPLFYKALFNSLLFVARNGACIGWVGLQDETRHEAKEALHDLKDTGVRRVAMVSGDRQPVATRVAKEIGCEEVVAECLPQNKVEHVKAMRAKGYRVAVVGDGVNDAPALAAGDLGIAMGFDKHPRGAFNAKPAEWGLPETGFVFCCFNACKKLNPAMFDV